MARKRVSGGAGQAENGRFFKGSAAPLAFLATLAAATSASAQLQLPGAVGGQSGGSPPKEAGAAPAPHVPPKPTLIKPPADDTIVGVVLKHDGTKGLMTFERPGPDLTLTKLTLTGEKISKPNEDCSVDVALDPPVVARPQGRPAGANRFEVPVQLCPFSIDVLDGAALVSPVEAKCEIAAADCRVAPTGLWGPAAADISPKRAQDMEHDRVRLETTMRSNFRALLARAGKDRQAVKAIAKDQAAFSSDREMTCRDYDKESEIGFCSTQITEARALALIAKFGIDPGKEEAKKPRAKPKPKPADAGGGPGAEPPTAQGQ